jgi:anti-sigma B factor antagonist
MIRTPLGSFSFETEKSTDATNAVVTTVKCHGRLVSDTNRDFKDLIASLIPKGGRIVIDLADVEYMDSSGIGTLVGLKTSAMNAGHCRMELINLQPQVAELLRITKLTQIFAS